MRGDLKPLDYTDVNGCGLTSLSAWSAGGYDAGTAAAAGVGCGGWRSTVTTLHSHYLQKVLYYQGNIFDYSFVSIL